MKEEQNFEKALLSTKNADLINKWADLKKSLVSINEDAVNAVLYLQKEKERKKKCNCKNPKCEGLDENSRHVCTKCDGIIIITEPKVIENSNGTTFEKIFLMAKKGNFIRRLVVKNDTVITIYKDRLYHQSLSTGQRYKYSPSDRDLMATDWVIVFKN